jgi:beta-glucosidase
VLLGNYHGEPSRAVTFLEGLRTRAGARGVEIAYARGAPLSGRGGSSAQLADARAAVRRSDAVVAILGLSPRLEGEEGESAGDRTDLGLPAGQQRLLEAVAAMGKPVVLVLTSGSALAVPWAAAHVPAIVQVFYPGEEGGTALADVLFGDVSPSGRLPVTVYRSAADLPPFADYAMRGRTYRYLETPPLFPFGHGLSYTTFGYSELAVVGRDVSVLVQNTGARAGDEVVQLYLSRPDLPGYAPRRWLAGVARVHLGPGERRQVHLSLRPEALSIVDEHGRRSSPTGEWTLAIGAGEQPVAVTRFVVGG